jgi:hypothetical protein
MGHFPVEKGDRMSEQKRAEVATETVARESFDGFMTRLKRGVEETEQQRNIRAARIEMYRRMRSW